MCSSAHKIHIARLDWALLSLLGKISLFMQQISEYFLGTTVGRG